MSESLTPAQIRAKINEWITTNGDHEITGAHLNLIFNAIMCYVGAGYACMGYAPSNAPSPDINSVYIADAGTYTGYTTAPLEVKAGQLCILLYDGEQWSYKIFGGTSDLGEVVEDGFYITDPQGYIGAKMVDSGLEYVNMVNLRVTNTEYIINSI